MTNLIEHLALISESDRTDLSDLTKVSAAMQKQASRDIQPIWDISATVDAFVRLEDVPTDYWPIIIMDEVGIPGVAGIHQDKNGQPFALVTASPDIDEWSLTVSHEIAEMLVDPFGRRLVAGDSIKPGQGRVDYLVEVCDPSEHARYGYSINGVLVSDFYTPHFFDPAPAAGVRYSFTGAIQHPRQVLDGGYLSWRDTESGDWWQQTWFGGPAPEFVNLGPLTGSNNFRSQIDRLICAQTAAAVGAGRDLVSLAGIPLAAAARATSSRADDLHSQIQELIANAS